MLTIYGPMIYTAPYVMCLMGQIHYKGHWKGWAMKVETFLGPEKAEQSKSCVSPKKSKTSGPAVKVRQKGMHAVEM